MNPQSSKNPEHMELQRACTGASVLVLVSGVPPSNFQQKAAMVMLEILALLRIAGTQVRLEVR